MKDRLIPQDDVIALIHSDEYANWVFDDSHPTQGRRFIKAAELLRELAPDANIEIAEIESDYFPSFDQLQYAHTPKYIEQVLLDGESGEWSGQRRDLGATAQRMAGGTILAAEALLQGRALTAVNFAGAKHHAMADHSSGFCVFNDFVIAALHVQRSQRKIFCPITKSMRRVARIAILDIDAHHGDGTEKLLLENQRVFTFSVHDKSAFPGTGHHDNEDFHAFNRALEPGSGDPQLEDAVADFVMYADRFGPDMIFIAMGADGHETDPLSSLQYTIEGMVQAVRNVRRAYPETPILLGGAGGYQPDTITPEVWARMAIATATPVAPEDSYWVSPMGDIGYLDDPDERAGEPMDEHIDQHLAQHAHLFAQSHQEQITTTEKVTWVAPSDPENEHRWFPALIGQIKPGEKVRVMRDAYRSEPLDKIHNGRFLEVIEVKDGDVICTSIDDRLPTLNGTHYPPYHLEQYADEGETS
jgi:acetoin utilization protein AcuC